MGNRSTRPGRGSRYHRAPLAPSARRARASLPPAAPGHAVPGWLVKTGLTSMYTVATLVVMAIFGWLIIEMQMVLIGLFMALVITAILGPVVSGLNRFMPRWAATAVALLGTIAGVVGALYYVINSVAGNWNTLALQFRFGLDTITSLLQNSRFHVTPQDTAVWLQNLGDMGINYIQTNWSSLASTVLENAGSIALTLTIVALAIFLAVFFLAQGNKLWAWFIEQLPVAHRDRAHRAACAGWYTFSGYARGTMIVASTNAFFCLLLLLVLGVPLPAPLSVLVFIGSFIPLVGAPTAMVIAMVVALAAKGVWIALAVGVGIALIGQIEGHVLQPLIMSHQVSIHPAMVAFGVAAGTFTLGLIGAVIAIPVIAVTWSVFRTLRGPVTPLTQNLPGVKEIVKDNN